MNLKHKKKKLIWIFKQQLQKSCDQDYNNATKKKIFKSIDCCLCPAGRISWIIFIFADYFYVSETLDAEVTKSLCSVDS